MQFYRAEPTADTSWRLAILMGANSRTYKFALGSALIKLAREGRDVVSLSELAEPYALALTQRAQRFPQGPAGAVTGDTDFLNVVKAESQATLAAGVPTERLLSSSVATMPGMVMQKFHNLRALGEVPHTFYELGGRGSAKQVRLTQDLHAIAASAVPLGAELDARWSIVECSFDAGIGRSLLDRGVVLSLDGKEVLQTPSRRAPVASARAALSGFQHGRCFFCHDPLPNLARGVHVDHLYPFALMKTGSWTGPDLNGVWNLVVACADCNLAKSSRLPSEVEVRALIDRNEAIMGSPHPLRRSLELTMTGSDGRPALSHASRTAFLQAVDSCATGIKILRF